MQAILPASLVIGWQNDFSREQTYYRRLNLRDANKE
jgi:hypothetical protein